MKRFRLISRSVAAHRARSECLRFALVFLTACLPTALSLPARAGEALETVVTTATREPRKLMNLPGNTDMISREDLLRAAHTHISESMVRIAGALIERGDGQESLTALRSPVLTGAGGCGAFLIAEDGVPLRATGFCNINELLEVNTEQAERIEVVRGPGTALQGSNAMHGMINVISPIVSDAPEHEFGVEAGPYDYYRSSISVGNGRARADLNGVLARSFKDHSGFRQQKVTASHRTHWDQADAVTTFALSHLDQDTAGFITGHNAYRDDSLRTTNPNPEAYRKVLATRLHSRIELPFGVSGHLILTPYLRYNRMDFLQHFLPGEPRERNGHWSVGVMSSRHGPLGNLADLIYGVDLEYTRGYLEEVQAHDTVSDSAFLRGTIPRGVHYDYDVTAAVAAAFVQAEWPLFERAELAAGVRAETLRYDYDNLALDGRTRDDGTECPFGGCRFNRPADRTDNFTNWSPHIGLTYRIRRNHQIYLLLAHGFRAPQATELYRLQNEQSVSRIGSEGLDSVELGFRGYTKALNYSVSLYAMQKNNFIFRDSNGVNVDNGKTRHRGIEASLRYALTRQIELSVVDTLAIHRYAYSQVLNGVDINGNDIDTAPRNVGSAHVLWRLPLHAEAELEWVHMGAYYEDPENLHTYPGHNLLNLRVSQDLKDRWTLSLRLMNLANRDYAERADFGFGEDRYFVGAPRALYLSISGPLSL